MGAARKAAHPQETKGCRNQRVPSWLNAEIAALQPEVIVCLGATTAQALFGRDPTKKFRTLK
jgi:uracil-DNA glycosylase